ncbi:hypothetical protein MHU86_24159 [Fragilaria crotonensis]|nr:hypothetical protein MHU86_24159 [Fragilaria crotonensis]
MESTQQQDTALTLTSRLKRLPRNTRRLLSHINFASDEDTLWKLCQRKQILTIAFDGGLKGRKALRDQQTIGWDNAIKGYLSVEWRCMAEHAMFDSSPAKPDIGFYRIHNILKAAHVLTQTTWKAQNKMLHDHHDAINRHIREAEAAEITAMHRQSENLRAGDRHYCEQPLEKILNKLASSRRRWIRYMKMAQDRSSRDGKRQTLLTNFFRPSVTDTQRSDTLGIQTPK